MTVEHDAAAGKPGEPEAAAAADPHGTRVRPTRMRRSVAALLAVLAVLLSGCGLGRPPAPDAAPGGRLTEVWRMKHHLTSLPKIQTVGGAVVVFDSAAHKLIFIDAATGTVRARVATTPGAGRPDLETTVNARGGPLLSVTAAGDHQSVYDPYGRLVRRTTGDSRYVGGYIVSTDSAENHVTISDTSGHRITTTAAGPLLGTSDACVRYIRPGRLAVCHQGPGTATVRLLDVRDPRHPHWTDLRRPRGKRWTAVHMDTADGHLYVAWHAAPHQRRVTRYDPPRTRPVWDVADHGFGDLTAYTDATGHGAVVTRGSAGRTAVLDPRTGRATFLTGDLEPVAAAGGLLYATDDRISTDRTTYKTIAFDGRTGAAVRRFTATVRAVTDRGSFVFDSLTGVSVYRLG